MEKGGQDDIPAPQVALGAGQDGPGSETERFQAITDSVTTRRSPANRGSRTASATTSFAAS